jgi:hypothetical protein
MAEMRVAGEKDRHGIPEPFVGGLRQP